MSDPLADKLPAEEIMEAMSKIAVEAAYRAMATHARELARSALVAGLSGPQALTAFADALEGSAGRHGVKVKGRG